MTEEKNNKIERVLGIYTRLLNGSIVKNLRKRQIMA